MKIDRYTKGVLTVIAACLLYLCMCSSAASINVSAQTREGERVLIAGWVDRAGNVRPLSREYPLPVNTAVTPQIP
jgi:hypothetical protein